MDIIQAIKERRSVRSFDGKPLSDAEKSELTEFADIVCNPFGGRFTIRLKEYDIKDGFRPSTYGMIKGACCFFTITMASDEESALAVGFCFEQIVLKAWQMGLGTCWIAATFKGSDFDKDVKCPDGETLRIVSPVGRPDKKSFVERIARLAAGSNHRKPFSELFYSDDFSTPLLPDSRYGKSLAMLRLAPSSTNSQPWRALVVGDIVHFYYVPKGNLSVLDTAIGISHFFITEAAMSSASQPGHFFKSLQAPPSPFHYLISYRP